jgi:hypothetical protein
MTPTDWVVINYTLPREPSRVRVSLWRKLKKIGAINIQQSMWILPMTDENYHLLGDIKNEIIQSQGEAFVMKASMEDDGQKTIEERFNSARNEEYGELLEQCENFFKEIDKEIARENFTFAEIEENEEELDKLKQWYMIIENRDTFGASLKEKSRTALFKCAEVFEKFCNMVYKFTSLNQGD